MRTIDLTKDQMSLIYDALDGVEDGKFDMDVEIKLAENELLIVNVTGWLETDGYVEDDFHCGYMNGTGAYVETYRSASVELSASLYDEDGEEIDEVTLNPKHEKDADKYLNIAA